MYNKEKVKKLLKNKLNKNKVNTIKVIRPKLCDIKTIESFEADEFYNKFHYIGPVKAKINYGVYFKNKLIACCSFKKPTRQSKYDWELVRMASNQSHRVHGIWSKILKQFISDYKPSSIVSFSDNRLFSGETYEKIGFKFDNNIPADYYWCKNQRRFHKSGLRKNKSEKSSQLTETELRTNQGYWKIWDIGKKRWVLKLND